MSRVRRGLVAFQFVILYTAALWPAVGRADEPSWAGRTVVLKRDGVRVGHTGPDGNAVYDADLTDIAYPVQKETGGWLLVRHGGVAGWFDKGDALLPEDAVAYFSEQLQANAGDAVALAHRGRAWAELGEPKRALDDLDAALQLMPQRPAWLRNRGLIHADGRDYDKALRDFAEAIRLNPRDPLTFVERGRIHKARNENDQAIADCSEAIRLDPKWAGAYFNRGNLYKLRKDHDQAVADYTQAIQLMPKDPDAYFNRANVYRARKEYAKAVADFAEVVRLDPKAPDAHDSLAWVLATCPDEKVRDGAKAIDHAGTACELIGARSPYLLETLAAALAEAGKFDLAVKWQTRALESGRLDKAAEEKARERLALFEKRKPYREE
jgi:tetratricopeptide (TPR) repeat protein